MFVDFVLASLHHLLLIGLVAILTFELAVVREGLAASAIRRVARADSLYGLLALALLIVGFSRVYFGIKGPDFYFESHVFWTKIAAFVLVGLLSIPPTLRILGWSRAARHDPAYIAPPADIAAARRFMHIEAGVLLLIPILAAAMARGY